MAVNSVATCGEAETAVSIMERMTTGKFRHIPVIERDQLVGIVSIGDIVARSAGAPSRVARGLRSGRSHGSCHTPQTDRPRHRRHVLSNFSEGRRQHAAERCGPQYTHRAVSRPL